MTPCLFILTIRRKITGTLTTETKKWATIPGSYFLLTHQKWYIIKNTFNTILVSSVEATLEMMSFSFLIEYEKGCYIQTMT